MRWIKFILFGCVAFGAVMNGRADITDFSYESGLSPDFNYPDVEGKSFERELLREMAEEEPLAFNEKELRLRDALVRATKDVRNQRTASEVLPILRSMSRQQRLAMLALVMARSTDDEPISKQVRNVSTVF